MTSLSLWRDPVLLAKKAVGRVRRRFVNVSADPVMETINGTVQFEHKCFPFLDEEDFRAMVTKSYDIILCDFLKKHLKPDDVVLDAGANVGYISALAASRVGPGGEVHGFEPLPECFVRLQRLQQLNPGFRLFFNNVALGETEGVAQIAYNPAGDSRNATLVTGKNFSHSLEVPVKRLDDYIKAKIPSPERISLIKIDVEGFEYSVLQGLSAFLRNTSCRPLIVCEVKPWELSGLGVTLDDFDRYMSQFGYGAYMITAEDAPIRMSQITDMEIVVFRV